MKHILLSVLALASCIGVQAQTIYSTTLNTQEEFDEWTVINANNDTNFSGEPQTWCFSPTNTDGQRTYYSYHTTNKADDWLISPAITPSASGDYLVSYKFEGGTSYPESLKMFYGSAPTIEALSKNLGADYPEVTGVNTGYFFVKAQAGVPFYVAFYACSEPDRYRLYAEGLEVKLCENPVDLAITEITAPTSKEGLTNAESVKLKIANTGLADAAAGSYTVTINVDGVDQFTETINQPIPQNGEIEVTLNGKIDLSTSHHTYAVKATVNNADDISSSNNSLTASIRHIGPAVEPYTMGFETTEDLSDLLFYDLNNDDAHWSVQVNSFFVAPSRTGQGSLCYNYSKVNQADDWAILDGIQMKAGYHVLKFWVSTMDDSHTEAFSVFWGNQATPTAMKNKIAEYDPITQAEYKQKICIFKLDSDQTVYIGFHATSPADQNWIGIDDVEVNSISATDVDLAITEISNPIGFLPILSNHDVVFKAMNEGVSDTKGTIKVAIDGTSVYEKEVTLIAQVEQQFTLAGLIDNLADGEHTLSVSIVNASDVNSNNNTEEVSFTKLGSPDLSWDFEGDGVPKELTVRSEDTYTLSDAAFDEFGETGVNIMQIENHQYYGRHMLGISTWFTETGSADRWVVLPKIHVNSANSCFVLNAGSANSSISERYRVKVSDGDDVWYDYTSLLSVDKENYVRKNRGFKFGEDYAGKDVYVAINVTTYDGDCLTIDNIGLHDCNIANTGVNDISIKDGSNFLFDGNTLSFGDNNSVSLNVYNVNGKLVYTANGKSFNISNLAKGVYIIRAVTANGVQTGKIVK